MDCSPAGSSVHGILQARILEWLFVDSMDCRTPGFPVHHQLLQLAQLMSIELVMLSNHLILCRPLHLLSSIVPSIRVFSNESILHIR